MPRSEENAHLIDVIYDAALDAGKWPHALKRLGHSFGCSSAHLSVDYFTKTAGSMISVGTDPDYARRYADYYAARNVLWQQWMRRPPDAILTDRTLMPKEQLRRSEFYNDFLHPQEGDEILISVAWQETDRANILTLWRPERLGPWERGHMTALATLTPHLRRALQANQCISDLCVAHDVASEALHQLDHGVIFADDQARLLFANRAARAMLADARGLCLEQQRLTARRAKDAASLRRLIAGAAAGGGGSVVIQREMRPSLMVMVMPVRTGFSLLRRPPPVAILFVKDLERPAPFSLGVFAQYFDLTPAQSALAHEVIRGDGVRAAAARLGMSYATARTHLLQIFQKTGTTRQAELVRLMLEGNEPPAAAAGNGALRPTSRG
jgi:DNA-binding CsgD family transcriptional regulator